MPPHHCLPICEASLSAKVVLRLNPKASHMVMLMLYWVSAIS